MIELGYRWHVNGYEPNETQFATLEEVRQDIIYHDYDPNSPHIGIDWCENDDGFITVLEKIVIPSA